MEIRFVEPAEVEQLRRNVQTAFPSKTPQALLDNMPEELVSTEEGRYLGCRTMFCGRYHSSIFYRSSRSIYA